MRGGSRDVMRGGRGGEPSTSPPGRGNSSSPPGFLSTRPVDASSLSRPVRPLRPAAAAAPAVASPPTSSSSSAATVSAQSINTHPITFLAFVPTAVSNSSTEDAPSFPPAMLHCIASQLAALLSLPTADFLSHCLHNSSLHVLLSSYLHHASQLSAVPSSEYAVIVECVYFVFQRFSSAAPPAVVSAAPFVAVPLLLPLCSLYYPAMPDSTAAIVDRLMAASPSLVPQLSAFCDVLGRSLDSVRSALSLPAPLSFVSSSVGFLSDSFSSLHTLFACTPSCPSTAPFAAHSSFLSTSLRLYERLCELGRDNRGEAASSISECRRVLISALHAIIDKSLIQPLQRESGDVKRLSDTVYQLVADSQQHTPLFLAHYTHLYRLSADIKKIAALPAVVAALGAPRVSQLLAFLPSAPSAVPLPTASLFRSHSSETKEEQSIAELRAMFDNAISDDFARACLREYNGELDVTLQHIFDNALPARLQQVSSDDRRHWKEDGPEAADSERQGDMLADGDDDNAAFQAYLLRTGRVTKADSDKSAAALSRSSLSLFEADPSTKEMLKERIIASQALDAMYDDEFDDGYQSFISFAVDETAVDVNDRTDSRRGQQQDRTSRAIEDAGGGEDVRARWRREEEEREQRKDDLSAKRIELIPPSRRTEEEKKEWERLTRQQQPQQGTTPLSAAAPSMRGMRGMRARGGQLSRGGGGRGASTADSSAGAATARGGGGGMTGSGSSGAPYIDGSLGPPRGASQATRGRGRGGDSRASPILSAEEKESERNRRVLQAAKDREERKRRLNSEDDDEEEAGGDVEEDETDLSAQSVIMRGAGGAGDGAQTHDDGAERGGGRGRGRGSEMRHTYGSGPRHGNSGGGGRGKGHNARGAHKAMAMKKMNSGMMR